MLQPNDEFLFTRQRHEADVMGLHYDLRLVHGDKAYSFATLKDMPGPGEIIAVYEQPVHDRAYALSKKVVIPTGQYGAGVTHLDWVRKAMVAPHSTETSLVIFTKDGQKFLLKKSPTKENEKSWIFRNITGMGKSQNPYLKKIEEGMDKQASFIGGAIATHLLQNVATNVALGKRRVSRYLANSFAQGARGVVDNSIKARALRTALGATLPDISVAHKSMHDLGRAVGGLTAHATPRQRVAVRMLTQGRFNDLKKYDLHRDPVVQAVHNHVSKHLGLPSLDHVMSKADDVAKLWKDKTHPLLSNIATNITKGAKPEGKHFVPGHLTAKPGLTGAVASFAIDPAAGSLNTAKNLMASKKVANNKYGKKVVDMLNNQFIKKPIKAGVESEGRISQLKNRAYKLGVNPLSAHLKRTSSALTDVLKD
jgi:hypothetical protein